MSFVAYATTTNSKNKKTTMKKDLQALLLKEVDRKDFLKHVGFGLVALTGVAALTKSVANFGNHPQSHGFGAGVYGGSKRT